MSNLNKALTYFIFAHLFFLGVSLLYMSVTSQKINRIDITSISKCFDNFDVNTLCVLDRPKGKIYYTNVESAPLQTSDFVLVGDSHSIPVFMLILNSDKLLEKYDRVIYAGVSSCFPVSGFVHKVKTRNSRCKEIYELAKMHDGDLGLALYWSSYLLEGGSNYRENISNNLSYSFPNAQRLIFFEEKPSASVDPRAIRSFQSTFANVKKLEYEKSLYSVRIKLEGSSRAGTSRYLNLYRSLCNGEVCSMVINVNGNPKWAYSDRHHLSRDGLTFLAHELNSLNGKNNNLILKEKNIHRE